MTKKILLTFYFLGLAGWAYAQVTVWAKAYGGALDDFANSNSIQQTSDGGYIMAGYTISFGTGGYDAWVLKLDADSNVTWQKAYGGISTDYVSSIQQTSDGNYIVAGVTDARNAGYTDFWIFKLDVNGNIIWQKIYGGASSDWANYIQQTFDGGYIVAGDTYSFGEGNTDSWVLKLDANGNVIWQKTYGGVNIDNAYNVQQTSDGGYIVTGITYSFGAGGYDAWVLKLDGIGNIIWQKTFGGAGDEQIRTTKQTSDGGYIMGGYSNSFDGGSNDAWVLKLDNIGNATWQKSYGGTSDDYVLTIQQTSDGGNIVAGITYSFGAGNKDILAIKLDAVGNVIWQKTYGGAYDEQVRSIQQTNDGGYIMAGYSFSFGAGSNDVLILKLDANGEIPGCSIMGTSNAVVTDTSAIVYDTSAIVTNTPVSGIDTNAIATDTTAAVTEICYYTQLTASASASPTTGSVPLFVSFTGSATGGISPYAFNWDFGDGSILSTLQNPSHTYTSAGSFPVTLTVSDSASTIAIDNHISILITAPTYDLFFRDDHIPRRSTLCVNSVNGNYIWTILSGPNAGNYTGTVNIRRVGGLYLLSPKTGPFVNGKYNSIAHSFIGSFFDRQQRASSGIIDRNTTDNGTPTCQ